MLNNWWRLICLANVAGLPKRLAPVFLNAFNVSCSGTDVCASLWLCELGWKQSMMLVFDAQNSGCRSLRSSFPPLEHMVCVVSAHQSKEAFKHVLIDGRGWKQVPRVDVCEAELCAFPSCVCWRCPILAHNPASTLISQSQCSRQLPYQICQRFTFQNLIFQFWIKDVYGPHYWGIMWKMYKTCQCCLWAFVFDKRSSFETRSAQKAMDRFLPAQTSFKSRSACLGLRLGCLWTAASGPPSGGAVPATLAPTLLGTVRGTAHTHTRRCGKCVQLELHTDPPSAGPADRVGWWSPQPPGDLEVHRLLSPSSCGASQA